jgi:hypothetical protein
VKKSVFITIILIFTFTICFAADIPGIEKLDNTGNNLLFVFRRIGYWIVLGGGIGEIIKCSMRHDRHGVGVAIAASITMYGSMYLLPWVLKLVEGIF